MIVSLSKPKCPMINKISMCRGVSCIIAGWDLNLSSHMHLGASIDCSLTCSRFRKYVEPKLERNAVLGEPDGAKL